MQESINRSEETLHSSNYEVKRMKIDLAAVVVTYKTKTLLENCLTSFFNELQNANIDGRIIVVDNASGDGTPEMVAERFPDAIMIANTDNYGPAKAFNQGVAQAIQICDTILVLNSDIEILPGTIKVMLDYLKDNPSVLGVNGPLLNPDKSRQFQKTHIWNIRKPDLTQKFQVEFVGTTFGMIRAAAFQKIGGYDENYYFYNEDLDWADRAKRAGLPFYYLPNAPVIHFLSKGSNQNRSRITRELYWSNMYYYKKFYPNLAWLALFLLKLDLNWKAREIRRKLSHSTGHDEIKQLQQGLEDLKVSRERMVQEFEAKRTPQIPIWK